MLALPRSTASQSCCRLRCWRSRRVVAFMGVQKGPRVRARRSHSVCRERCEDLQRDFPPVPEAGIVTGCHVVRNRHGADFANSFRIAMRHAAGAASRHPRT